MSDDRIPLLFVIMQSGAAANGGIESISQVIRRLRKYRPVILTNLDSRYTHQWRSAGIETYILYKSALGSSLRRNWLGYFRALISYWREISRIMCSTGARMIHANDPLAMQIVAPLVRLRGWRMITCLRGMPDPAAPPNKQKYKFIFGSSARLLFLSSDMASRWENEIGRFRRPISITYSIIDPTFLDQPRRANWNNPYILLCGSLRSLKGQEEFLSYAAPAVTAAGIRILFAGEADPGEPAYEIACRRAAEPYGDMVEFLGHQSDVRELYSAAVATVVASRAEGLSRSMIEAMACGCPVVSFDISSAREILGNDAGRVVAAQDWASLAGEILNFYRNQQLNISVGLVARSKAKTLFDHNMVLQRYEAAYAAAGA